jgi:hypothetical protein
MERFDRRAVLVGAAALLAGCASTPTDEGDDAPADGASPTTADGTRTAGDGGGTAPPTAGDGGGTATPTAGDGGGTATPTAGDDAGTATPTAGALDLREANVTGVAVEGGDGEYRFDVTLYHDVRKSEALAQPIRNLRFLRTTRARTATRTGGRSRASTASASAAGTWLTPTAPGSSPARRRWPSATGSAWSSGATTGPTATAGRRWW